MRASDGYFAYAFGTSMAAAQVAGIAALVLERNPNLTYLHVIDKICSHVKSVGDLNSYMDYGPYGFKSFYYGYGLTNAYTAAESTR